MLTKGSRPESFVSASCSRRSFCSTSWRDSLTRSGGVDECGQLPFGEVGLCLRLLRVDRALELRRLEGELRLGGLFSQLAGPRVRRVELALERRRVEQDEAVPGGNDRAFVDEPENLDLGARHGGAVRFRVVCHEGSDERNGRLESAAAHRDVSRLAVLDDETEQKRDEEANGDDRRSREPPTQA